MPAQYQISSTQSLLFDYEVISKGFRERIQTSYLAPRTCQSKVSVDIIIPELFGDVEAEASVLIVNPPFFLVAQSGVSVIYFAKLTKEKRNK